MECPLSKGVSNFLYSTTSYTYIPQLFISTSTSYAHSSLFIDKLSSTYMPVVDFEISDMQYSMIENAKSIL